MMFHILTLSGLCSGTEVLNAGVSTTMLMFDRYKIKLNVVCMLRFAS